MGDDCKCVCPPDDCNDNQFHSPSTCECKCKSLVVLNCEEAGGTLNSDCSCICPDPLQEICDNKCVDKCAIYLTRGDDCDCVCPDPNQEICNGNCIDKCSSGLTRGQNCDCVCPDPNQEICNGNCVDACPSYLTRGDNCDCICPTPNTPDCPCDYEYGTDANGCETIGCKDCYPKMMANFKSTIEW